MVDYVVKLTKDATKVSPQDHERLRGAGLRRSRHPADHADRVLVQLHQPRRRCAGSRPRMTERFDCDRQTSLDRSRLVVVFLDDFEDISVRDRERRSERTVFLATVRSGSHLASAIALSNAETRRRANVMAICRPNSFSNREGSNSGSSIKCSSIAGCDFEPGGGRVDVARPGRRLPAQHILEEIGRDAVHRASPE